MRKEHMYGVYSKDATHGVIWCPNAVRGYMPFAIFETHAEAQRYADHCNTDTVFNDKYIVIELNLSFHPPKK